MQLHLKFKGTDISLPIAYRSIVQGMLYHALGEDSDYSGFVHDHGNMADGRKFKGFTFGPLSGAYSVEGRSICFGSEIHLEVRSVNERFIELLTRALPVGKCVQLGKNEAEIIQSHATDYRLLIPEAGIRLISPMIAYVTETDGRTRFFGPEDDEYLRSVEQNARRKWVSLNGKDGFDFHIEPVGKKAGRKEVTSFKQTYITAWYGEYRLSGDPEVIDLLYQVGLGAKSSQGFGMFSLR